MQQFRADQHGKKICCRRAHDPADRIQIATRSIDERGYALAMRRLSPFALPSRNPNRNFSKCLVFYKSQGIVPG